MKFNMKNEKLKGIFYIIVAAFGFSLMSTFVKLSGDLPAFQKAFFRNFIALILITVLMLKNKDSFVPKKGNIPALLGRSVCGTAGLLCNFYALGSLNLSDANMLNKLSPFFAVLFSALLLKERPGIAQVLGVAAAFLGSVFIIKPSFSNPAVLPALAGALGGMGAGAAYTFVRKMGMTGENNRLIIFYFSLFSCAVCLPVLIITYEHMTINQTVYLILAGTFACVGQMGITKAYVCAPAKEISVYDYTQVLFAAVIGYIVFGNVPDLLSVLGYILICGSGIVMFILNNKIGANKTTENKTDG